MAAFASFAAMTGLSLSLAGCAPPPPVAHGPEYFPSSVYGEASPKAVASQEDSIPHGGGFYKVGQPYVVDGKTYYPSNANRYSGVGYASWYGDAFHGRRTANGEIYSRNSISAAHPTMPLPSYARVTNLRNHYSIIVRVNDRGPFARDRVMDVSQRVAELLDFRRSGTTKVKIDYVGQASLAGSDDAKLMATLRQDGRLAQLDMRHPPTFVPVVQTAAAEIPGQLPPPGPGSVDPQTAAVQPGSVDPQVQPATVATDDTTGSIPATETFKGTMPLPPSRPFDLDAGANSQVGALR
ncbi:MAG TPA: septal ring lytic transglycosylase RlpA family protein [Methylovirgula sp.]